MTIDKELAIDCLNNSNIKAELFKALNYFELAEPLEFIKLMENRNCFKNEGSIGKLLYFNSKKFPQIFAALFYLTAQSCYFSEPHPSGERNFMLSYIADEPYRLRSVIDHYLAKRKYVLTFIDEQEYYAEKEDKYYGIYEPANNYKMKEVLEVIDNYEIKLNKVEFYGIDIKELPDIIVEKFTDTEIHLINCPTLPKREAYSKLKITEII